MYDDSELTDATTTSIDSRPIHRKGDAGIKVDEAGGDELDGEVDDDELCYRQETEKAERSSEAVVASCEIIDDGKLITQSTCLSPEYCLSKAQLDTIDCITTAINPIKLYRKFDVLNLSLAVHGGNRGLITARGKRVAKASKAAATRKKK